ncbi:hypothetical protein A33Q_3208 [Indibacter alkaliphilus LW1]|jgi:hypothetical protein|uniref:Lipocalin-like domain-containing protein n=1 Tax=Indibacter alkaliphilus (strain CCUG 57479 / KCTC 22604 / LW1) TaxID=1189612 RepID=S2DUR7_INDAL|nr:hypothetical protein [Indibacter alkaliphilus]EOZ95846.1 hypothetical protein A33Q_3208 [Indibacter alkaliphilus LW1]
MRKFFFGLLLVLFSSLVFSSCNRNGDDDPDPQKTPEELATEDLTGGSSQVWTLEGGGSVVRDNRSETANYSGFEITFSASQSSRTYATVNNNDLFDSNGNWSFVGDNLDKITLTGSRPASNQEISFTRTGNDLRLQFTIPMPSNARVQAVAGSYTFNLKRKD